MVALRDTDHLTSMEELCFSPKPEIVYTRSKNQIIFFAHDKPIILLANKPNISKTYNYPDTRVTTQ